MKSTNTTWQASLVSALDRQRVLGQRGCVIWLTGLSGSGKSTIARALEKCLIDVGRAAYILDGDNIRQGLNSDLGFSPEDREENIRRIGEVAALLADAGPVTLTAFISPYRAGRDRARQAARGAPFIEVYLNASVEDCRQRDPKGLYAKADAGAIRDFTGVNAPYEPPNRPEIVLDTVRHDVRECVDTILQYLGNTGVLGKTP